MSIESKRRYAAAAFVTLLILSVFWPSPVVSMNRLWVHEELDVDDLSFLGREAPSWDAVFWCIAGLLLLAIVGSADASADPRGVLSQIRSVRFEPAIARRAALGLLAGVVATAI